MAPVPESDSDAVELLALLAKEIAPETAPPFCGVKTTFSATLCPAGIVTGNDAPGMENWPLLLAADEIVTLPPVAVREVDSDDVFPTVTLPKLSAVGLTLNWPIVAIPVPESDSVAEELLALLANEIAPETAPLLCGVKATLTGTLCPAAIVSGNDAPLIVNWPLLLTADEIVTLAPLALNAVESVPVDPTLTLPKLSAAGLMLNCPITAVPVPNNDSVAEESLALLANEIAPEIAPLLCGVKAMLTGMLCPTVIVIGNVAPLITNCPLLLTAEEIVTLAPLALNEVESVAVLPTLTLPKLNAEGLTLNCPTVGTVAPMPDKGTFSAGPTTKMRPLAVPAAAGVNVTFSCMLCPAPKVIGKLPPVTENPEPVVFKPLSDIACDRVLVSTTVDEVLLPTFTWPNEMLGGFALSACVITPVPPVVMLMVWFDGATKVIFPPVHPFSVGAKFTVRSTLCPAASVSGKLTGANANCDPLTLMAEIVVLVCELFVTVTSKASA
jgi:hypothetical protein